MRGTRLDCLNSKSSLAHKLVIKIKKHTNRHCGLIFITLLLLTMEQVFELLFFNQLLHDISNFCVVCKGVNANKWVFCKQFQDSMRSCLQANWHTMPSK